MNKEKILEVQVQIIVNNSLFNKKLIDEVTYSKVNEKLLKSLKVLKLS